jgi:uncharacterized membrane protein
LLKFFLRPRTANTANNDSSYAEMDKGGIHIDLENGSFSFFPFGALFCLTLFCFVAVRIYAIRHRYIDYSQKDRDIALILKSRMANGELDEKEYHRLKDLLTK